MTVSMMIINPADQIERTFHVPVLDQNAFDEVVLPVSRSLDLNIISLFETGTNVSNNDLDIVENQLRAMLNSIPKTDHRYDHIVSRTTRVIDEMRSVFEQNAGAILFIG